MIYLLLFLEFFKIGLFTFGGGYAMIPLVKDVVTSYNWLTEAEFYDFIGVCESTPGPIAINMATYVGNTQGGPFGGVVSTLGVVLPSFIIILLIAMILKNFINNKYVQGFLKGVQPIIVALILIAGLALLVKCIGFENNTFNVNWVSIIILPIVAIIYYGYLKVFKKKMSAITLIIISAVLGLGLSVIMR